MPYKLFYRNRSTGATGRGVKPYKLLATAEIAAREMRRAMPGLDVAPILVVAGPATRGIGLAPPQHTRADLTYKRRERRQ